MNDPESIRKIKILKSTMAQLIELSDWYRDYDEFYPKDNHEMLEKDLNDLKSYLADINILLEDDRGGKVIPVALLSAVSSGAIKMASNYEGAINSLKSRKRDFEEYQSEHGVESNDSFSPSNDSIH